MAESKLLKLSEYLVEEWNLKTRDEFLKKFDNKIKQISLQPESCPKSTAIHGLYKCVVTKQNTFFYRLNLEEKEIEIITVFDTRMNPEKLRKET